MTVVVVDDERADAQGAGVLGDDGQGHERRELVAEWLGDEVVAHQQGRVPGGLGASGGRDERIA